MAIRTLASLIGTGVITATMIDDAAEASIANAAAATNLYYLPVDAVHEVNLANLSAAPQIVAGYNLSQNDDVLLVGQTTQAQNGPHNVDTLGTSDDGEWSRMTERDETAELPLGLIVFDRNTGAHWKLVSFGGTVGTDAQVWKKMDEALSALGGGELEALGTGDGSTLNFNVSGVSAGDTLVGAMVYVDGIPQPGSIWSVNQTGNSGAPRVEFASGNAPASSSVIEIFGFVRFA